MHSLIEIKGADIGYGRRVVLRNVDLSIQEGDFLGIVGPNGAGKTTLLRTLLGLVRPNRGSVSRASYNLRVGYVPQRDTVDPIWPLSALDVALMGLYPDLGPIRRPGVGERQRAETALEQAGIAHLARHSYSRLSGGQRQRTLIARALVGDPRLLVLDEPTNGLDLIAEHSLMELVRRLHEEGHLTVVMVTHLINTVTGYAKRLAVVGQQSVTVGETRAVLTAERMTALYGAPVEVDWVEGQALVRAVGDGAEVAP